MRRHRIGGATSDEDEREERAHRDMITRGGVLMRVLVVLTVACAGCFGSSDVDISAVEIALVAGSSIGHAADVGNAGMDGSTACVAVTQPCTSYPCNGAASLTLGSACPEPLGGVGTGSVAVSGQWTATDTATLMLAFSIAVGDGSVALSQAIGVSVKPAAMGNLTVAYTGQNVSVSSGATLAAQSSWTVAVDEKGTPADPSDDVFTINGAQQGAGSTGTAQVTLTQVVLDPSCRKNPIAGMAVLQQVTTSSLAQDTLSFHAACDGKVDVGGTLGGRHSQKLVLFKSR